MQVFWGRGLSCIEREGEYQGRLRILVSLGRFSLYTLKIGSHGLLESWMYWGLGRPTSAFLESRGGEF